MQKLKVLTLSAALSITGFGLLAVEKVDASDLTKSEVVLEDSTLNNTFLDTPVLNESNDLISPLTVSGSGWLTKGGIKARVSTSKDQYALGENVVVKAERSGSSPTVYYRVDVAKRDSQGRWIQTPDSGPDSGKKGTFTNGVHNVTLKTYGSGIYKVNLKVFSDSSHENWIGDWETSFSSN